MSIATFTVRIRDGPRACQPLGKRCEMADVSFGPSCSWSQQLSHRKVYRLGVRMAPGAEANWEESFIKAEIPRSRSKVCPFALILFGSDCLREQRDIVMAENMSTVGNASTSVLPGNFGFSPTFLSLIAGLTVIVLLISKWFNPDLDDREPPALKSRVPVIGHLIGLLWYQGQYFKVLQ